MRSYIYFDAQDSQLKMLWFLSEAAGEMITPVVRCMSPTQDSPSLLSLEHLSTHAATASKHY